jgi:hypothetical protein
MKSMAAAVVLASACAGRPAAAPEPMCDVDADCGGDVCARTHECAGADEVRIAKVTWTVAGMDVGSGACAYATSADFIVELKADPMAYTGDVVDFAPVPCTLGAFTIDKLPVRFWIGGVRSREAGMWVPLDANGVAAVALPF